MMRVLLESAAPGPARLMRWTSGSVVAHGGIVVAAVLLTLAPAVEPIVATRVEDIIYTRPQVDPPPMSHPAIPQVAIPRLGAIDIPAVAVPRITFPDVVPQVGNATDFPASAVFGDPRGTSTNPNPGRAREGFEVDQIVRPRAGNPPPVYPASLRSAAVEGDVLVRFVVDTLGRVEPRSVEVRETTHALFADAVRDWLQRTRYDPATIAGHRVRQLVEQRVGFTLRR
jgi:protein TonB